MKYTVQEYIEYNVDGTPNGRTSSEKGDVVELPHALAQRLLDAKKITPYNPTDTREKKVVSPSEYKVIQKGGGWVDVLDADGNKVDKGRGDDDYERLKKEYNV